MATLQQAFSLDDAKIALTDVLTTFKTPENSMRMSEARDNAGNDMLKTMQVVFPLATQIQMDVIPKYGFSSDGDGIIRFAQTIKMYERQDEEIAQMNAELRSIVMPQMAAPEPQGATAS